MINWIIRFLKESNGQSWSRLIENYVRCLDNLFDIEFFSLKVTDSSELIDNAKIPAFYKECIRCFQELLRLGRVSHRNNILWCNHELLFLNKPLCFTSWSKSGIKTISDVYSQQHLNSGEIRRKLTNNFASFMFQMAKIRKVLPRQLVDTLPNNDLLHGGKEEILQMQINIPNFGTKPLIDLTSKDIYRIFLISKVPVIPSHRYWQEKLGTEEIDWDTWYIINSINKYTPRPVKDFNWRLANGLVNFNSKLRHMTHKDGTLYSNGNCSVCNNDILENGIHCLYECPNSKQIWLKIEQILSHVWHIRVTITSRHALSGFWENGVGDEVLLKNMIMEITRYHIWKVRNSIQFDAKQIDLSGSSKILKYSLLNHISILLSVHKDNGQLCEHLRDLKTCIVENEFL